MRGPLRFHGLRHRCNLPVVEIGSERVFNRRVLVHHGKVPGNPVGNVWGSKMRKGTLLLAVLLAACFTMTDADAAKRRKAAGAKPDPAIAAQKNSDAFIRDWMNPWAATQPKAPAKKAMRAKKMAKKKA